MKTLKRTESGFTLLEILLVVAAIAILAGIVIFAINPGKQLAELRNGKRRADISLLVNAVYQYAIDNGGNFPSDLNINIQDDTDCNNYTEADVCYTGGPTHFCGVDLSDLTSTEKYLISAPLDPQGPIEGVDGTGYFLQRLDTGRVIACAPRAELGETIQIIR